MKVKHIGSFDFRGGVQVEREDIDRWTKEVLTYITEENQPYTFISSGNSMVLGINYGKEIEIYEFTSGYVKHDYKVKKKK